MQGWTLPAISCRKALKPGGSQTTALDEMTLPETTSPEVTLPQTEVPSETMPIAAMLLGLTVPEKATAWRTWRRRPILAGSSARCGRGTA
jgi:hypothetical protein